MDIKIEGIENLVRKFENLASLIPDAVAKGINDTVYGGRAVAQYAIKDSFDRPTPAVLNGVVYDKASKENLVGAVRIKGEEAKGLNVERILDPHVYGGGRVVKASESMLRRAGLMGSDQWIVPGPGAPRDAYGNISGGNMRKILSQIQADTAAGYDARSTARSRKRNKANWAQVVYCVPRKGVFARTGQGRAIPILFFTNKAPQYKPRFDFYGAVGGYVQKNAKALIQAEVEKAIKKVRQ